jgi:transcriptional regulator with XRE-family HTH domain
MHETTLTRIERGTRKVTVDDAVAIAAALDVPLISLLLPSEADEPVQLTPKAVVTAEQASEWAIGLTPLVREHRRTYDSHVLPWQLEGSTALNNFVVEAEHAAGVLTAFAQRVREAEAEMKETTNA